MWRADERAGALHDRGEHAVDVEPLEQADRRTVQRRQLGVARVEGLEGDRRAERHRRLVRKGPQRLQPLAGRQHRVGGIVGPDEPAPRAVPLDQGNEQPVVRPGARAGAAALRRVRGAVADESPRDRVLDQVAALDLELRHEELVQVGIGEDEVEPGIVDLPARRSRRGEAARRGQGRRRPSRTRAPARCRGRPPRGRLRPTRARRVTPRRRAAARATRGHGRQHRRPERLRSLRSRAPRTRRARRAPRRSGGGRTPARRPRRRRAAFRPHLASAPSARPRGARRRDRSSASSSGMCDGSSVPVDLAVRDQVRAAAQKSLHEVRLPGCRGSRRAEQHLARTRRFRARW